MIIKELILYTPNLEAQKRFYTTTLEIPLYNESEDCIEFMIGNTLLKFINSSNAKPYHIAINIPANKELEALDWLKERVSILKSYDNEIIDFVSWNAKAIYFYDKDNNIVEFIARKNLSTSSDKEFNTESLLEISEIGIPVGDIEKVHQFFKKSFPLEIYFGDYDTFCAMGGERGLFIVINKNKKKWFPTYDEVYVSDFKITIEFNSKYFDFDFLKGKLKAVQ